MSIPNSIIKEIYLKVAAKNGNRTCYYAYMDIRSARFIKGVVGPDAVLEDGMPQVAFVGRSNVGKSSVINSLTGQKTLAKTSSSPGRTTEINIFFINERFYLIDLPGYGYAKASHEARLDLRELINWYLFMSHYEQKKIVLIIDAKVGLTDSDLEILQVLEDRKKDIVIVANKIDKIRPSKVIMQLKAIGDLASGHRIIPYSSKKRVGFKELSREVFN
ncbi:MAG: ribosome biogenesis GTP-binding protein YihA/YsxC [Candidatus Margulisiibacteriota bacterium]